MEWETLEFSTMVSCLQLTEEILTHFTQVVVHIKSNLIYDSFSSVAHCLHVVHSAQGLAVVAVAVAAVELLQP